MNYKILDIDPLEKTVLIEWEDGAIINHAIPVDYVKDALKDVKTLIKNRTNIKTLLDLIIKKERP